MQIGRQKLPWRYARCKTKQYEDDFRMQFNLSQLIVSLSLKNESLVIIDNRENKY